MTVFFDKPSTRLMQAVWNNSSKMSLLCYKERVDNNSFDAYNFTEYTMFRIT